MLNSIFKEGWELNVLLYGLIFLLAQYLVYKIIFSALVGSPKSYGYEDQRYWYRKASFLGAVIFAPLFEELMFTYLAYASFLNYAVAGQEGIVILFVAAFFALLHLPGDLRQVYFQLNGKNLYLLAKFQLHRFFYSLAAYFIYQWTGHLWVTITLHYLFNAIVSIYNFDLEDHSYASVKQDGRLTLIMILNIGFALSANYLFYDFQPQMGLYLIPLTGFILGDYILEMIKENRVIA